VETFMALLKTLKEAGIDPAEAGIRSTPDGLRDHEITFKFRLGDHAAVDDVFAELIRLGLKPLRSGDGQTLTAGIDDV
jgi:hypothetical protein